MASVLTSPETEVIRSLCRTPLPESNRDRASEFIEGPISIERLLALAHAWRVEPVVMGNLGDHFADVLPAAALATISQRERDSRAITLGHTLALVELVRKFDASGIPVLVLKGPAIGVTGYGDPSLRQFADFDLLVKREDIRRARDLALAIGYERNYPSENEDELIGKQHALEFSRKSTKLELHSALLSSHLRFGLDPDDAWRESVTVVCAGSEIRTLAPHQQFLFVCAHGTKHGWVSLHWICDVAQLAERLSDGDRNRVVSLAGELHLRRILALSVRVARELVCLDPTKFPDSSLSPRAETDALVRRVTSQFLVPDSAPEQPGDDPNVNLLRFWVSTRERWIDRLASLAFVLFVPTDKDRAAGPAAWIVRPVRLGLRAVDLRRFFR